MATRGATWFKESLVKRDVRGRFANKYGGKVTVGSLENEIQVSKDSTSKNAIADEQEAALMKRMNKVIDPKGDSDIAPSYDSPQQKAAIHRDFKPAADSVLELDDNPQVKKAVDDARRALGFKTMAPPPANAATKGKLMERGTFERVEIPAGKRKAKDSLRALDRKYRAEAERQKDNPAAYMIDDMRNAIQDIADGMELGSLTSGDAGAQVNDPESAFGPGPGEPGSMNTLIRKRLGR